MQDANDNDRDKEYIQKITEILKQIEELEHQEQLKSIYNSIEVKRPLIGPLYRY